MKRSTGLRNYLLDTGSMKAALAGKVIIIYEGTEPATADAAIGGAVPLVTISVDGTGTGVTMEATASGGQLVKNTSEVWKGTIAANGTASFFRMQTPADSGASSTTAVRIQGTCALNGGDMDLSTLSLILGNEREINSFVVSISAG